MSDLKPCPFCGDNKASMRTDYDTDGSNCTWKFIECKCGVRTRGKWFSGSNDCPIFYEEVRDQWNNRTSEVSPSHDALFEDMLGALKKCKDEYWNSMNNGKVKCMSIAEFDRFIDPIIFKAEGRE